MVVEQASGALASAGIAWGHLAQHHDHSIRPRVGQHQLKQSVQPSEIALARIVGWDIRRDVDKVAFPDSCRIRGEPNARAVVAQKTIEPQPGFRKYKVGDIEVTALYDGFWEKPHDPAFIKNASLDETKAEIA